jgi:hypothetical protein
MGVGSIARKPVGQQVAYLRQRVLGTAGNQTASLGWVPAGANILRVTGNARTVFSGGTPAATIGSRASPANVVAVAATALTTLGFAAQTVVAGAGAVPDVDTELVIAISGSPTAGVSDITVEYTVPDETP